MKCLINVKLTCYFYAESKTSTVSSTCCLVTFHNCINCTFHASTTWETSRHVQHHRERLNIIINISLRSLLQFIGKVRTGRVGKVVIRQILNNFFETIVTLSIWTCLSQSWTFGLLHWSSIEVQVGFKKLHIFLRLLNNWAK